MIKISGTLAVRTINGRKGAFNVGKLATEIGEFAVKDPELEQYDEGRYEGDFGVVRVYPTSYVAGGRVVVEIRAELGSMALAGIDTLKPEDKATPVEQDPAEETPPAPAVVALSEAAPTEGKGGKKKIAGKSKLKDSAGDKGIDPEELFGTLWPLGNEVKLDSTVDRVRFRQQSSWLKDNGYEFKLMGQQFVKT